MPPEVSTAATPTVVLQGWVPLIGIVVALLAPLGPAILSLYIAHRNGRRSREAVDTVAAKLSAVDEHTARKLDVIHTLVNSRLTAALEKIDELERRLYEKDGTPPSGERPIDPHVVPGEYPDGPAT